jgi:hypothetical protein
VGGEVIDEAPAATELGEPSEPSSDGSTSDDDVEDAADDDDDEDDDDRGHGVADPVFRLLDLLRGRPQ